MEARVGFDPTTEDPANAVANPVGCAVDSHGRASLVGFPNVRQRTGDHRCAGGRGCALDESGDNDHLDVRGSGRVNICVRAEMKAYSAIMTCIARKRIMVV